jgi:hypothetical protein
MLKDMRPIKGRYYIPRVIAEGEHETQDFKYAITDARKIARSLSAFANHNGGRLLVGVKDNGAIAGVRTDEDLYLLDQAALSYCRPPQRLKFTAFTTEGGPVVVRAEVDASAKRPVEVKEADGSWRAYYRVNDENIAAPPLLVEAWRLAGGDGGQLFTADGDARLALDAIGREPEGLLPERFYQMVLLSADRARAVLTKLIAAGIVTLDYRDGAFRLYQPR